MLIWLQHQKFALLLLVLQNVRKTRVTVAVTVSQIIVILVLFSKPGYPLVHGDQFFWTFGLATNGLIERRWYGLMNGTDGTEVVRTDERDWWNRGGTDRWTGLMEQRWYGLMEQNDRTEVVRTEETGLIGYLFMAIYWTNVLNIYKYYILGPST